MISLQNKKGILIGAESRANVFDESGHPACYYDKTQKVFLLGNKLGLATTGSDFINQRFVSTVIRDYQFSKSNSKSDILEKTIKDFIYYLKVELKNIDKQLFVFCGMENSCPVRYVFQQGQLLKIDEYSPIKSFSETKVILPDDWMDASNEDLVNIAKNVIEDYSKEVYSDGIPAWQRVGGPVDLLWLSIRGNFKWLSKKKAIFFDNKESFKEWVVDKKNIKILLSDEEFKRIIKKL